jgi:hypothetical protein
LNFISDTTGHICSEYPAYVMGLAIKPLELGPDNYEFLHTKGWGLYKQGKYTEALDILRKSWDLRRQNAVYEHEPFLHLEAAKKAVAEQKNK